MGELLTTRKVFTQQGRKEGYILINDAHSTFYLPLYGIGQMVKNHSDRHGICCHMGYSFFCMHHPTYRIAHTTVFVTPVVMHWLE